MYKKQKTKSATYKGMMMANAPISTMTLRLPPGRTDLSSAGLRQNDFTIRVQICNGGQEISAGLSNATINHSPQGFGVALLPANSLLVFAALCTS
jgi:hypothetical protein